jgi:hypothetical protein
MHPSDYWERFFGAERKELQKESCSESKSEPRNSRQDSQVIHLSVKIEKSLEEDAKWLK